MGVWFCTSTRCISEMVRYRAQDVESWRAQVNAYKLLEYNTEYTNSIAISDE